MSPISETIQSALYLEMTASSIINVTNAFVTVSEEHILTISVWKLVSWTTIKSLSDLQNVSPDFLYPQVHLTPQVAPETKRKFASTQWTNKEAYFEKFLVSRHTISILHWKFSITFQMRQLETCLENYEKLSISMRELFILSPSSFLKRPPLQFSHKWAKRLQTRN